MNPWELLLAVLGWGLLGAVLLVLALLLGGLLAHGARWARKRARGKRPQPTAGSQPTAEDEYLLEATIIGVSLYGTSPNPSLEAFRAGARWAWAYRGVKP